MPISYNKDVSVFKKWVTVRTWMAKQALASKSVYGLPAVCDQVNRSVNTGFVYQRDGLNDLWFTPVQFTASQGGDCEDFSIYKMYQLARTGVDLSSMELVICTDRKSREHHCVLRVFSGNYQYILDNQSVSLLTKDTFNKRYEPIYAIGMPGWRVCAV